jgi:hypothetical protein
VGREGRGEAAHCAPRCYARCGQGGQGPLQLPRPGRGRAGRSGGFGWGGKGYYTVHLIVTPAVVREARAHFNCPDLEGAELKDQVGLDVGDLGTVL